MMTNKKIIDFKKENIESILFCGDIHGEFDELKYLITQKYNISNAYIFLCGDIGLGFYKPNFYINKFIYINNILIKRNVFLFLVRGNHDDPKYFKNETPITEEFSNIILVQDNQIFKTQFGNILCIGGAISIDRTTRTEGLSYWPDETITKIKDNYFDDVKFNIDIIVSHSAPAFVEPYDMKNLNQWAIYDNNILKDCAEERAYLSNLCTILRDKKHKPSFWFYGHFHEDYFQEYDGVRYYGLNIMSFKEIYMK